MDQDDLEIAQRLDGTIIVTTSWNDYATAALEATVRDRASPGSALFPVRNIAAQHSELDRIADYYGLGVRQWEPRAVGDANGAAARLIAHAKDTPQRPRELVVSSGDGACELIAAYYALATGKRLVLLDAAERDRVSWPHGAESVVLVGPADLFTKSALGRLLARWRSEPAAFGGVGILTARTFEQLSAVVCRQLMHRAFTDAGHRSAMPAPDEVPNIRAMRPLEYYVLIGHGSETHIDHADDVLCADRSWGELNEAYWPCLETAHLPARQLAVHHLFVLSCDLFTPVDGLAPAANSLFHDLLAGWPSGLVAPFKHAQINNGFTLLTDSVVRAGYSLGEITAILNGVAPRGTEPDAAYVLLGDPDTRIFPDAVNRTSVADVQADERGFTITALARGRRIIDCSVPDNETSLGDGEVIAPTPVSEELMTADCLVATLPRVSEKQTRYLVIGRRDLAAAPLTFRVTPVSPLTQSDRADLVARIGRLGFLENLGVDLQVVSQLRSQLLAPLRNAGSFPRAIDFMLGAAAAHQLLPLLHDELKDVRRTALKELCAGIARERSWFNHRYRKAYPSQRRLPGSGGESTCPECAGALTRWRSDDPAGAAEPRTLDICERCGIVGDRPTSHPLTVTFDVGAGIHGSAHRQRFHVTNTSDRRVAASLAAQFNQWETLGIRAEPGIVELDLEPGASSSADIDFTFTKTHPTDLISLHCYAMSDRCEVAAFTRRLVLDARPSREEADAKAVSARPRLAILEPLDSFFHYLEVAHDHGFETVVLTSDPDECRRRERQFNHSLVDSEISRIDHLIQCQPGDPNAVVAALEQWGGRVAGLVAGDDHFVPVVAAAGRALGFDYALPDDAIAQQRKSVMKVRLAAHGVPTPRFAIVNDLAAAQAAWRGFGCDAIVKMVDYQGSMNVNRVLSEESLRATWDAIRLNIHGVDISRPLAGEVLVEEYVPGRELSAEGFVENDRVVILNYCGKITAPNFIVVGHLMPVELSAAERATAASSVEGCVRALGIRNSVFHIELHIAGGVAYVIEASSRPPGQHMVELMKRSYGWDLMGVVIDLAVGAPVRALPTPPKAYYAMAAFYAEHTGTLVAIRGLDELRARPGVLRLKLDLQPGVQVRALTTFRDRYGFVITEHQTARDAEESVQWIREQIGLEVIETSSFV